MNQEECIANGGEWKEVDGAMVCVMPEATEEMPASEPTEETPAE